MAGSSLFALIDDIATLLDDVSVMTKVAAQKTAGVLGDDLALNAQQVAGVNADRELPVVWAVAKGSAVNKLMLVPAALAISTFVPWAVSPLLMLGGMYLCFEGVEKLAHKYLHPPGESEAHHREIVEAIVDPQIDMVAFEKEKVKGAIRTDFVLSAEIITIALGTVAGENFVRQLGVLAGISVLMTVGVYGIVAGIVKLDDAGIYLSQRQGPGPFHRLLRRFGLGLVASAPYLMKGLSIAGTIAMFMVGGGILTHGIPGAHDVSHGVAHALGTLPALGWLLSIVTPTLFDALVGVLAGALALVVVTVVGRLLRARPSTVPAASSSEAPETRSPDVSADKPHPPTPPAQES